MRVAACLAVGIAAVVSPQSSRAAEEAVDVELVLAVDVSGSMNLSEQALQRSGYVAAIRSGEFVGAVTSGLNGRIALTYVEWAGPGLQRVAIPWQAIDGQASADAFAAALERFPLGTARGTSISAAILHAATLFERNGFDGARRVIDVSGDGPNNMGVPVTEARDAVVAQGIVINGLPILLDPSGSGYGAIKDLDVYYERCVIGGPGAFLLPVVEAAALEEGIRRKMVLEVADLSGAAAAGFFRPVADGGDYDCLVGERQRQRWMDP